MLNVTQLLDWWHCN